MLLIDERAAIEAIPAMLAREPELAIELEEKLHRLIDVVGLQSSVALARLSEVEGLFRIANRQEPEDHFDVSSAPSRTIAKRQGRGGKRQF